MATTTNFRPGLDDMGGNQEMSHSSGNFDLPYDDPAIVNPTELASFPKKAPQDYHPHSEHDSHLVSRRSGSARDGSNITRTW